MRCIWCLAAAVVASARATTFATTAQYYDALTLDEAHKRDPARPQTLAVHRWLGKDRSTEAQFREIADALGDLGAAPRVFDAGCGLGAGLAYFARTRPRWRVAGATISPEQRVYVERHLPGQRVLERSYDEAVEIFGAASLDAIYCVEAIVHSPSLDATLRAWAEALRVGGRVAILDDFLRAAQTRADPRVGRFQKLWMATSLVSTEELAAAGARAGLEVVSDGDLGKKYDVVGLNYGGRKAPASRGRSHQGFDGSRVRRDLYVEGGLEYRLVVLRKRAADLS